MTTVMDPPISPMLATAGPPPTGPGWAVEFKWNGMRGIATITAGRLRLTSRLGNNITDTYPDLAELTDLVNGRSVVLDGEIVAYSDGRPNLPLLQHRMGATPREALLTRIPVHYQVFDVLNLDGEPVTQLPYAQRRMLLRGLRLEAERIRVPLSYTDLDGHTLLGIARVHGLEGIVSKRLTSTYRCGHRSLDWVKTTTAEYPATS